MLKILKRLALGLLLFISIIGFSMSAIAYLFVLIGYVKVLPEWIYINIFAMPLVFIIGIVIAIKKTTKDKEGIYLYGIRFWPAIRKVPSIMAILIYVFFGNIIMTIILRYRGIGDDFLLLPSGLMIFYYIPLLVFLSALLE